jgi:hypothetical protein
MKSCEINTFELSNIGIYLNVAKDKMLYRVTHTGLFAQTTDAILRQTEGFIATQINDNLGSVAASLIASTPLNRPAPRNLSDAIPFVASVDGKDFQVAGLFVVDAKNVDEARRRANAFMMENEGTSLIDSSVCNSYGEVETIHIIVHGNALGK